MIYRKRLSLRWGMGIVPDWRKLVWLGLVRFGEQIIDLDILSILALHTPRIYILSFVRYAIF